MRRGRHWTSDSGNTRTWGWRVRVWRFWFKLIVHRHRYALASDRWVFSTTVIYDRKGKNQ